MAYSILGAVCALVIFAGGWLVGFAIFTLWDQSRGLGESVVQELFRELAVPAGAGYLSNYLVAQWVQKADTKAVFFLFSIALAMAAGAHVAFVGPLASRIDETALSIAFEFATYLSGIVGAFVFARDKF